MYIFLVCSMVKFFFCICINKRNPLTSLACSAANNKRIEKCLVPGFLLVLVVGASGSVTPCSFYSNKLTTYSWLHFTFTVCRRVVAKSLSTTIVTSSSNNIIQHNISDHHQQNPKARHHIVQ